MKIPPLGGTLTVSIARVRAIPKVGGGPARSAKDRILAELQQRAKLNTARPSDEVETLRFEAKWEPVKNALGVPVALEDLAFTDGELGVVRVAVDGWHAAKQTDLVQDSDNLDFEALLRKVLYKHAKAILRAFQIRHERILRM